MTKRCCICGREFEPQRKSQVTCLDPICRKERDRARQRVYARERLSIKGEDIRAYKREKQREYRAKAKGKAYEPNLTLAKPEETSEKMVKENYAERQMRKSLALAGKVKVTL